MIKIMLFCCAGMSTSLLVTKMQKAADKRGIEAKIWAVSQAEYENEMKNCDVCLLGPQVKYLLKTAQKVGEQNNVPVAVISPIDYGMVDGNKVLDFALSLKKGK
mgnify:CR=1 FL=1